MTPPIPKRQNLSRCTWLFFLGAILFLASCKQTSRDPSGDDRPSEVSTEVLNAKAIKILGQYGCLGCHSENGSRLVGPTFKGLWGRQVELSDGRTVTVDEDYIRKSIMDPDADIVKGYPAGLMPRQVVTEEELAAIIGYLKNL